LFKRVQLVLLLFTLSVLLPLTAFASAKRVLVVMSYHPSSNSESSIREGIESVLTGVEVHYVYLDTKIHPEAGVKQAERAFEVYERLAPDVVIAADDNAQKLFVLPYIKDKRPTPVVFCGVNDDASKYGYPNPQVTGIIEKKHYHEGLTFARLLLPSIKRVGVIYRATPSNSYNLAQIRRELSDYPVKIEDFREVRGVAGIKEAVTYLEGRNDAILVLNLAGLLDASGKGISGNQGALLVSKLTAKPTIGTSKREIKSGILCGVAKINKEQGLVAASMARDILAGKSPGDIPVTSNRNGQRLINVTTAKRLALSIKPVALIGTDLVQ